jgi:ComF family protein
VALYEVSNGRCSECRRRPVRVTGSVRVGPYRVGSYCGPLGHLLRAYKYHRREELEPLLGGWLAEVVEAAPWRNRVEAVVPVPTHWRRRIMRPFYPAERLASFVAKRMGLPLVPILRRTRTGPKQIGLSYTNRVINVHGAFAVRPGVSLDNTRLLIVDDVKTTGATINECARVLRRAGAAELYAAFVVRAGWQQALGGPLSAI